MKAFVKTLFGDVGNICVVAALMAVEAALVHAGHARIAALAMPPLILAGVGWLAAR